MNQMPFMPEFHLANESLASDFASSSFSLSSIHCAISVDILHYITRLLREWVLLLDLRWLSTGEPKAKLLKHKALIVKEICSWQPSRWNRCPWRNYGGYRRGLAPGTVTPERSLTRNILSLTNTKVNMIKFAE